MQGHAARGRFLQCKPDKIAAALNAGRRIEFVVHALLLIIETETRNPTARKMKSEPPFLFRQLTHGVYVVGVSRGIF
jgi:hypothetical protein